MDVAAMTQSRIKLLTKMADKHGKCSSHLFTNPNILFMTSMHQSTISFIEKTIFFSQKKNQLKLQKEDLRFAKRCDEHAPCLSAIFVNNLIRD